MVEEDRVLFSKAAFYCLVSVHLVVVNDNFCLDGYSINIIISGCSYAKAFSVAGTVVPMVVQASALLRTSRLAQYSRYPHKFAAFTIANLRGHARLDPRMFIQWVTSQI